MCWLGTGGALAGVGIDPPAAVRRAAAAALDRVSQTVVRGGGASGNTGPRNPGAVRGTLSVKWPLVERYPQTFQDLARTIGADVLRYSEAAGQEPDDTLLARVATALGDEAVEGDPESGAPAAKIDAIINAAEKTGALDKSALAELPAELAEQVRAAAQARGGKTSG